MKTNEPGNNLNKKIMVLGAAGFIGKNLSLRLIRDGYFVRCFDRTGTDMDILSADNSEAVFGEFSDFSDEDKAGGYLKDIDVVYHLISTTCPTNSNLNIADEFDKNVLGTIRLLDACVKNSVSRVVFLSSGGTVYGREHDGILSEKDLNYPISSYGIQKLTIEKLMYLYHEMYGLDYRVVRLSNPYGPYQRPNGVQGVVSTFTWKALHDETISVYGDGSVVRDYIYIDDAVEGILKIASDDAKYRLYNLGSGVGTNVNEVIDTIGQVTSRHLNVEYLASRKVDVPVNILNVERFRAEFGPCAEVGLREGIKRLCDFYADIK